MPPERVI